MPRTYRACLIGCGRMGATIDDEVEGRPDRDLWQPFSHAAAAVACDRTDLVAVADVVAGRKRNPYDNATVPSAPTPTIDR